MVITRHKTNQSDNPNPTPLLRAGMVFCSDKQLGTRTRIRVPLTSYFHYSQFSPPGVNANWKHEHQSTRMLDEVILNSHVHLTLPNNMVKSATSGGGKNASLPKRYFYSTILKTARAQNCIPYIHNVNMYTIISALRQPYSLQPHPGFPTVVYQAGFCRQFKYIKYLTRSLARSLS